MFPMGRGNTMTGENSGQPGNGMGGPPPQGGMAEEQGGSMGMGPQQRGMAEEQDGSMGSAQGFGGPPMGGSGENEANQPPDLFSTADTDQDGRISEAEFTALVQTVLEDTGTEVIGSLADYDTDGDSMLSGEEVFSALDASGLTPPEGGPGQGRPDLFEAVDADKDQQVSEAEFNVLVQGIEAVTGTALTTGFAEVDTDDDTLISGSELFAAIEASGLFPQPEAPQEGEITGPVDGESCPMIELIGYVAEHWDAAQTI